MSDDPRASFAFTQRDGLPGAHGKTEERAAEARAAFDAVRDGRYQDKRAP